MTELVIERYEREIASLKQRIQVLEAKVASLEIRPDYVPQYDGTDIYPGKHRPDETGTFHPIYPSTCMPQIGDDTSVVTT